MPTAREMAAALASQAESPVERVSRLLAERLARRALEVLDAWEPGTVVCLGCTRAVPVAQWRGRCPACGGRRIWPPEPSESSAQSETALAS